MAKTWAVQSLLRPWPRIALYGAVVAIALVGCGGGSGEGTADATNPPDTATTLRVGGTTGPGVTAAGGLVSFSAGLTGAAEVPGPGDLDGVGSAVVTLDPARSEICFKITVAYVDRPDAAHIHSGDRGETGPEVVTLAPLKERTSNGCVPVDTGVIGQIRSDPRSFYLNLHNPAYPDGAMRGQLAR